VGEALGAELGDALADATADGDDTPVGEVAGDWCAAVVEEPHPARRKIPAR